MVYTESILSVDKEEAQKHLELLGYKRGDKIFMRYIHANPAEGQAKSIKKSRLNWEECDRYQSQGYDTYFVINGGGDTDAAVKVGRAIFYEHDNLPKDLQRELWRNLGLPEPTVQVDTGGKSIHSYWVFTVPIGIEDWRELQEDLLEFADGDRSIKNPSRILRLAGCRYMKGDNPGTNIATIITASGKRYSYLELRNVIQLQKPQTTSLLDSIELPVPESVPLEVCLTKRNREMLASGSTAPDKGRNDSGIELARDLIGTANYLDSLGQRYNGNPENLFFDWCRACGLDGDKPKGQPNAIWKSANKGNSTPGSNRDGVDACIRGWHWRENIKPTGRSFSGGIGSGGGGNRRGNGGSGGSGGDGGEGDGGSSGKVVRFPSFEALSVEQVTEKIDELVKSGATNSYLTGQLNRLAAASQFYIGELRKLYYERVSEADLECDRDTNRSEVDNLLKLTDQTLNLVDYLPEALATPLTNWCSWLSMRPAVVLTALLAGVSSLHKVGTELVIHQNKHFEVPPTLYAALVAESGQLKSPVFSNIIRQPLNQLRREKVEAYQAAMQDYEAAMQAWEQSENKGEKPKKPADPTLYFFTNSTGESIPVQASKVPDKALLALVDELSGLFRSENAHRGGRGSDKQDLLSYFDGSGQTVLRASGIKVDVERIYLTIFGTIQPDILKGHMSDCSDPDGQWARFMFVNQPLSFAPLGDDDGQAVCIRDRIADYYRKVERIPEMKYRLSRAAFKRYEPMHDHLERLRVTHPKPGMRAVCSKMKGIIGRLALNLHVLWELDAGKACPDEEIPLFIMEMAIALAKFYIGQIKLVHADSDNESLPTHIVKLVELSKRLEANGKDGWIKAQQYRELFASRKRPSSQQARDWMLEAKTQGFGDTRGEGNRLEYHWRCDNNDNPPPPNNLGNLGKVREDLGKGVPYAKTIENKETETSLGNLGKGIPDSPNSCKYIPHQIEEIYEEGGYVPEPSLDSTQNSSDGEAVDATDLGTNLGNPIPNPSLTSLNEISHEVVNFEEDEAPSSAQQLEEQLLTIEQVPPTSADKAIASQAPVTAAANVVSVPNLREQLTPVENAPQTTHTTVDTETPQTITAKPADEAIAAVDDEWQVGDHVVVDIPDGEYRDLRQKFNRRQGVVQLVVDYCEQCLIDFGNDELMRVPFRGLRKV